jgi:hypothetical protein
MDFLSHRIYATTISLHILASSLLGATYTNQGWALAPDMQLSAVGAHHRAGSLLTSLRNVLVSNTGQGTRYPQVILVPRGNCADST